MSVRFGRPVLVLAVAGMLYQAQSTVRAAETAPAKVAWLDQLPDNQWSAVSPATKLRPSLKGWEMFVWERSSKSLLVNCGYTSASSESQEAWMAFSPEENAWNIRDLGQEWSDRSEFVPPAQHSNTTPAYEPCRQQYLQVGGYSMGSNGNPNMVYDLRGNIGRSYYQEIVAGDARVVDYKRNLLVAANGNVVDLKTGEITKPFSLKLPRAAGRNLLMYDGRNDLYIYHTSDAKKKDALHVIDPKNGFKCEERPIPAEALAGGVFDHLAVDCRRGALMSVGKNGETWICDVAADKWSRLEGAEQATKVHAHTGCGWHLAYAEDYDCFFFGDGRDLYVLKYRPKGETAPPPLPAYPEPPAGDFAPIARTDPAWQPLGKLEPHTEDGWARHPALAATDKQLVAAWTEYPHGVKAGRWDGASWQPLDPEEAARSACDFPCLAASADSVLLAYSGESFWGAKYPRAQLLKDGAAAWEVLGGGVAPEKTDAKKQEMFKKNILPSIGAPVPGFHKGEPHILGLGYGPWRNENFLHHLRWTGKTWEPDAFGNGTDDKWEGPGKNAPTLNAKGRDVIQRSWTSVERDDGLMLVWSEAVTKLGARDEDPARNGIALKAVLWDGKGLRELPSPQTGDEKAGEQVATWPAGAADGKDSYVAYLTRHHHGRQPNLLVVKKFDGKDWQALGGPLNVFDPKLDDWAFSPGIALAKSGGKTVPYVCWTEHVNGTPPQVFVKHWDGAKWISDTAPGASLNTDPLRGSAQTARIAVFKGEPVVIWSEHVYGEGRMREVYVKRLPGAGGK